LKTGFLGEMKAKANLKPSEKYHPQIMQLLLNPIVKGIKGAGYAPYMNFSIFDLSEHDIQILISHGKESFITDQIKAEPIEFLKAPDYIKHNKTFQDVALKKLPALQFILNNENDLDSWEKAIKKKESLIIFAPQSLNDFKNRIIKHLKKYPSDLLKCDKSISHDFDIVSSILTSGAGGGNNVIYVLPNTPRYKELCMIAIHNHCSITNIPEEYRTDELYKVAVTVNSTNFKYVPEHLKTYELCKLAVSKNRTNFGYVPEQFKTYELCKIVIEDSDGFSIDVVPTTIKDYDKLCKYAVSLNGSSLVSIPKQFRTNELCTIAVKEHSGAIEDVPTNIKNYAELCKIAVSKNGQNLRKIPHDLRTLDICLLAVEEDRYAISYVPYEMKDTVRQKLNLNESVDFKYFQNL
jgi:hypothetical protein